MGLCFIKRRTPLYLIKKDGRMSLKENFFSHTGIATFAEWLLVGRILILDVKVDNAVFLLINLYKTNEECEQLNVLTTLYNFLSNITDLHCKNIFFGRDFNVFFDTNYEAEGGNPTLKNSQ